jgi:polyhydroxyalkanoate synthesis regulator phasin
MNKRLAGTGLAIGLVAGAGAGLILEISGNAGAASGRTVTAAAVGASTDATTDTTAPGDTTAPATPAKPDPSTRLQDVLKPLVADGTITQDQADKVVAALVAARPNGGPGGLPGGGPLGGHRGPGGPGFGGPGGLIGQGLDVVATTLGITTAEVRTALQGGQSLADLAVSKGKTAQDVIDAVVAEATTKINAAVTAGKLTQDQADKLLANLTTGITDMVNATPPTGGPGLGFPGFGGPGRGFGPGRHHDDNANSPTDTAAPTTTVGS